MEIYIDEENLKLLKQFRYEYNKDLNLLSLGKAFLIAMKSLMSVELKENEVSPFEKNSEALKNLYNQLSLVLNKIKDDRYIGRIDQLKILVEKHYFDIDRVIEYVVKNGINDEDDD